MSSSERWWNKVREDQDRARASANFLAIARARGLARPLAPRPGPARPWMRWAVAAAAVAVAAAAAFVVIRGRASHDLSFVAGADAHSGRVGDWLAAPSNAPWILLFSDGTQVQLAEGSRARVSAIGPDGARVVLERGQAEARVVHRSASRWLFDVGPFEVVVVGTRFRVSWEPVTEVFRLELHEGTVQVSGACLPETKTVGDGRRLQVSCKSGHEEIWETTTTMAASGEPTPGPAPSEPRSVPDPEPLVKEAPPTVTRQPPSPPPAPTSDDPIASDAWRELIAAGKYADALALVERRGFAEERRRASGEELIELGDVARLAGRSSRAREAYLAARDKLPGGGRSAYGLGLTAFDHDRDYAVAAYWFRVYLDEQPSGELRREAAARLFEAWQAAGETDKARAAAVRYLADYPNGPQAALARTLAKP